MKQHTFKWLSFSLLVFFVCACSKKDPIARWEKGSYDMIHIITLANGSKDTIHCVVYGPVEEKGQYTFKPGAENDGAGEFIVYKGTKKKKGYFRIKYYVSSPLLYPTYYGGQVESYNNSKQNIVIHYKNEPIYPNSIVNGEVTLNWIN